MSIEDQDKGEPLAPTVALNLYNPPALGVTQLLGTLVPGKTDTSALSRYGFRLGNLGFLLHHDADSEVIELPLIHRIPNCSYWMRGVINLRGNLVPVFDIAWLLKIEKKHAENSLLLVLDKGDKGAGILINELPKAISLDSLNTLQQYPPMPDVIKKYLHKGYTQNSQVWFEFDHRSFFASLGERMRA